MALLPQQPPITGGRNNIADTTASNLFTNMFKPNSEVIANPNKSAGQSPFIKQGMLISFHYQFWVNDPYPVVIVTKATPGKRVKGINLNYLTFPFIKNLLRTSCSNPTFAWQTIKGDRYIENAFRSYRWQGVRQVKTLDCTFLLNVMATVRSNDPNEMRAIKESVREQIRREVNPKAEPTPEQPIGIRPQTTPTPTPTQPPSSPLNQGPVQQQLPFMDES